MLRDRVKITIVIRQEVMQLLSNGVIAIVAQRDLHLYFQGQHFKY